MKAMLGIIFMPIGWLILISQINNDVVVGIGGFILIISSILIWEGTKTMDLNLEKSILESDIKEILKRILDMESQKTNDGFGWNKEQLAEIKETAELLSEKVNRLECSDLEENDE